ncbi:conserved domain protein [Actinomyces sp. oral taxon 175 str. F0384]|nr:conserved domain protein [Actinomyces sp. oral taxon 175 str. F0384]
MMTTGHTPGEVPGQGGGGTQPGAADGAQNAPGAPGAGGAPSEQEVDYLQNADPKDDASSQAPEDPRRREARLKRRRRLLAIGGVPAALVTIISLWLGSIFLISLAGNRAAAAGHYDTALSRYRTVARINPWLEQWRVHFNLGTGQLAAKDPTSAVTTLNQALSEAPKAKVDPETKVKEAGSPECMVRTNLYVAHLTLAAQAQESGSSAAVTEHIEAAKKAADACEVPPPPEQNPSPSPNPSATPSSDPSSNPSATPSSDPSSNPSSQPSSDPSSSASSQPSSDPSSSPSSSSSPGETSSGTPSAKPTPTPVDDRAKRLRDRNNGSPGTTEESGGGEGGGKPW